MDLISAAFSSVLLRILVLLLPLSANASSSKIYVVYMGEKKHDDPSTVTASHLHIWEAFNNVEYPEVVSVKPNTYHEVHTTRSWDFLGLNYYQPSGLLKKANHGEDVIVGVIDTESLSSDDRGYGPVPKRWKGVCQTGEKFNATHCNRKIIGARWYADDASAAQLEGEYMSPRDAQGHGTRTASTIAGVPVPGVSYGGLVAGVARGWRSTRPASANLNFEPAQDNDTGIDLNIEPPPEDHGFNLNLPLDEYGALNFNFDGSIFGGYNLNLNLDGFDMNGTDSNDYDAMDLTEQTIDGSDGLEMGEAQQVEVVKTVDADHGLVEFVKQPASRTRQFRVPWLGNGLLRRSEAKQQRRTPVSEEQQRLAYAEERGRTATKDAGERGAANASVGEPPAAMDDAGE
ncbi:hypothetical protein PR202_gb13100 [Eleusine coracana subsp. coracana]|uniref:Uncharacterized protein n=1 Tax=Eleusine coracana subsp. coracana TaxID=191504 RepID=A0AAV5ER37_ELECO|nr:hypothetical protein PR202_gb13100 [Eleusine coracana subsp. coracana]